ncbi:MAG: YdeI/OmpD-associated family protein [Planctomycetota bacterium]
MDFYPHSFEATIERFGVGKKRVIWYNVVFLPAAIEAELPFAEHPRLRVEAEIAEVSVTNAFMPTGDGRYYLIVSPVVFKDADVELGDVVRVHFRIADQDHVDVPAALQIAVDGERKADAVWRKLTPGKRRMLAQHVLSAKTPPTESKRVAEALEALIGFNADLRAWRRAKKVK